MKLVNYSLELVIACNKQKKKEQTIWTMGGVHELSYYGVFSGTGFILIASQCC